MSQDLNQSSLTIVNKGNLTFTTSLECALRDCEIVFIAVGTPMGEDGSADLQYVNYQLDKMGFDYYLIGKQ